MSCERPKGLFFDMMRDAHLKFPPNWQGELPAPATRQELRRQMETAFQQRKLSNNQIETVLDFLEKYEERYYEALEDGQGRTYHRACNGGAMAEGETGVFCANCGKLPGLIPPLFP